MKELVKVQNELKAPKGQFNSFGKYKYRSCEDILEAVKPILESNGCYMTISDDIVNIGNRFYVKATAKIYNAGGERQETTAFAREEETKKGMDGAQVTGASSSYARKYALNGLLLIDDTKDPDSTNKHGKEEKEEIKKELESYPVKELFKKEFTQESFENFSKVANDYMDSIQALESINKKYTVSKEFEDKVKSLYKF